MVRYRYTPDALAQAASVALSVTDVMRLLGVRVAGGSHAHISRQLKRFGIDTSHFTGSAHSRGRRGARRVTSAQLLVRLPEGSRRTPGTRLKWALGTIGVPEECEECGVGPIWQGRPLILHVDHISGDILDNRPPNLRLLCPNCHSQTATFAGRNRRIASVESDTTNDPPNAAPVRPHELTERETNEVVRLFVTGALSPAQAASRIGCHRNSLYRLVRRLKEFGTAVPGSRRTSPRPEADLVIRHALANPEMGARRLAASVRAATDTKVDLDYGKVSAILRAAGLNTAAARRSRLS
jgi:transposase